MDAGLPPPIICLLYNFVATGQFKTFRQRSSVMGANTVEFTDANFDAEVLKSNQTVLVDFWAPWCGPCRQIAPMIDALAAEYAGSVKVGKVNVDDSPQAAGAYGVQSIPTLMVFKGGEVVERFVGAKPKSALQAVLDEHK